MKRFIAVVILLIFAWSAYANSVDRRVRALVDDLAKKYYSRENVSYEAFGLDPFMLTNGDELDEKLFNASYGRLYAGISIYF